MLLGSISLLLWLTSKRRQIVFAAAIQSGISADLNAMAQGMGFSSFSDAVAPYNAQYGTNYLEQQARDALAGK